MRFLLSSFLSFIRRATTQERIFFFLFSKGIAEIWFKTQKANKARTCFFFAIDVNCYWVFMEPNDGQ